MRAGNTAAQARYWFDPAMPYVESRCASDSGAAYLPHTHPTLSIGAVDGGHSLFGTATESVRLAPGDVVVIPAGQVHACNPEPDARWSYQMLHLDPAWVGAMLALRGVAMLPAALARVRVTSAPDTYAGLCRLNDVLFSSAPQATKEAARAASWPRCSAVRPAPGGARAAPAGHAGGPAGRPGSAPACASRGAAAAGGASARRRHEPLPVDPRLPGRPRHDPACLPAGPAHQPRTPAAARGRGAGGDRPGAGLFRPEPLPARLQAARGADAAQLSAPQRLSPRAQFSPILAAPARPRLRAHPQTRKDWRGFPC
ncbi:AraC family transcriptional regulator [Cupriavidus basilensis OR16]|uniref:AraC family transcriptional regulator n=1 Tax=Cupriavidus basilensis OR16 TaxID=1127483 RepID=H1SE96_9BURK|nr:AraC family transcriptional regulator [Cupriavidus basilensis OR16]